MYWVPAWAWLFMGLRGWLGVRLIKVPTYAVDSVEIGRHWLVGVWQNVQLIEASISLSRQGG